MILIYISQKFNKKRIVKICLMCYNKININREMFHYRSITAMSIFFIGDSRTVGQAKENGFSRAGSTVVGKNNQGDYYYAKVGEGLQWFNKNTPDIIQKSKDYDAIVVSLGVNDITNKQKYVAKMKELANGPWKGKRIYFTSVNPVDRTKYKGPVTNHMIDEFNSYVKKNLPSNIRFIDTNTHFKDKFQYTDGLHYKPKTNEAINDFITAEIQRDCAQRGYTQQQTVPENTGTGVNESTKNAMLKDQANAQETKQLLDDAENSNAFSKLFAGNGEDNLFGKLLASALAYLLTGKLPETSEKKEQAVQSADMDYTSPVSIPIASSQQQYSSLKDYAVKKWGKSSKSNVAEISDYILKYSKQYGVDPCFAFAIAEQESKFNQNIGSKAGAWGVFQLIPQNS